MHRLRQAPRQQRQRRRTRLTREFRQRSTSALGQRARPTGATRQQAPLGRPGAVDEVAGVIAFLVSPEASYMTCTTLDVSGGR
ncbi:MAG: SDR family oxidoreductase [Nocardioidaceae bacterium]